MVMLLVVACRLEDRERSRRGFLFRAGERLRPLGDLARGRLGKRVGAGRSVVGLGWAPDCLVLVRTELSGRGAVVDAWSA